MSLSSPSKDYGLVEIIIPLSEVTSFLASIALFMIIAITKLIMMISMLNKNLKRVEKKSDHSVV